MDRLGGKYLDDLMVRELRTKQPRKVNVFDELAGGEEGDSGGTDAAAFDNPMEEPGDLIAGGEGGAPLRLPVGAEGDVLAVVGGDLAWSAVAAAGGGPYEALVFAHGAPLVTTTGEPITVMRGLA